MRIFSKHQDYYDSCLSWGIDPNVLYLRREEVIQEKDNKHKELQNNRIIDEFLGKRETSYSYAMRPRDPMCVSRKIMIFCGKIYLGLEIDLFEYSSKVSKKYKWEDKEKFTKTCWSFEQVEEFLNKYNVGFYELNSKDKRWNYRQKLTKEWVAHYFNLNKISYTDEEIRELHFKYDTPNIYITRSEVVFNKILKDIGFVRCLDPYTTFQELSMFIGGIMGGKSPAMVEIEDEYRIAMKGFNEMSFRKRGKNS